MQTLLEYYPSVITRGETKYTDIIRTIRKMRISYGVARWLVPLLVDAGFKW